MEVLLRKTKITASTVKQSSTATESNLINLEVLGWCRLVSAKSNTDLIILYKDGNLKNYRMFDSLDKTDNPEYRGRDNHYIAASYHVEVKKSNYYDIGYKFTTKEERDNFYNRLLDVKKQSLEKGQIFL